MKNTKKLVNYFSHNASYKETGKVFWSHVRFYEPTSRKYKLFLFLLLAKKCEQIVNTVFIWGMLFSPVHHPLNFSSLSNNIILTCFSNPTPEIEARSFQISSSLTSARSCLPVHILTSQNFQFRTERKTDILKRCLNFVSIHSPQKGITFRSRYTSFVCFFYGLSCHIEHVPSPKELHKVHQLANIYRNNLCYLTNT